MRGFNLIEVMIVVSIMGVLAAIAVPGINEMIAKRQAQLELQKFSDEIEKARDDARANLRCYRITNPTSASLLIEELTPTTTGCTNAVVSSTTKTLNPRAITIPSAISLTFSATGALVTSAPESETINFQTKYNGVTEPHAIKVFKVLGLVRTL